MAAVEVGGDSSVKWVVDVDHVRHADVKSQGKGAKGHRQEGIDETDAGEVFTIFIEIPDGSTGGDTNANLLANGLDAAAKDVKRGGTDGRISFKLPILDHHEHQISIKWKSKP